MNTGHGLNLGRKLRLARGQPQPREETLPRPSSVSANCPGSGALKATNSSVNPTGYDSDYCSDHSQHDCVPMRKPDLSLKRSLCLARAWHRPTSSTEEHLTPSALPQKPLTKGWLPKPQGWPQICFTLSRMTQRPDYHALFTVLSAISTTMAQTSHPQDGLGYAFNPLTLASTLCLVKTRIQELNILLLIKSNMQDKGHPDAHTATGARIYPLSTLRRPLYPWAPPCVYKRSLGSLEDRGQHFTIFPPLLILTLASITHRDLGSTPFLNELAPSTTST
jgi:hypothetical protein